MTPNDSADSLRSALALDAYFSGEATPEERERVRQWVLARENGAEELALLQRAWMATRTEVSSRRAGARREEFFAKLRVPEKPLARPAAKQPVRTAWLVRAGIGAACAAGLALIAARTGIFSERLIGRRIATTGAETPRVVTTGKGQRAVLRLADGSVIHVGTDSKIQVTERPGGARVVTLDGDAYFDVKHAAQRPFIVQARHATTEVLGTSFIVRGYASDAATTVTVATGRVAVRSTNDRNTLAVLTAGRRGSVDADGTTIIRNEPDAAKHALAMWMAGEMTFERTPVRDVVEALERQFDVRIRIADSSLLQRRITGVLADESLDARMTMLATMLGATYERSGNTLTLFRK